MNKFQQTKSLGWFNRQLSWVNLENPFSEGEKSGLSLEDLNWENLDRLVEAEASNLDRFLSTNTMVHESIHWLQQIGTPYGYFSSHIDHIHAVNASQILKIVREKGFDTAFVVSKPILEWIKRASLSQLDNHSKEEFLNFIRVSQICELFYNLVEASNTDDAIKPSDVIKLYFAISGPTIFNGLSSCVKMDAQEATMALKMVGGKFLRELSENDRLVAISNKGHRIGGRHVMEGHARGIELSTVLLMSNRLDKEFVEDWFFRYVYAEDIFDDYGVTFDEFMHHVPIKSHEGKIAEYLISFLAISELALHTPLIPPYHIYWQHFPEWEDFHPGLRFIKACKALNNIKLLSGVYSEEYKRFISDLCAQLRWPSPIQMASAHTRFKQGALEIMHSLHARAAAFRQKHPIQFVIPGGMDALQLMYQIPLPLLSRNDEEFIVDPYQASKNGFELLDYFGKKINADKLAMLITHNAQRLDLAYQLIFKKGPFVANSLFPKDEIPRLFEKTYQYPFSQIDLLS